MIIKKYAPSIKSRVSGKVNRKFRKGEKEYEKLDRDKFKKFNREIIRSNRMYSKGFTLIEILVVIGIIAVLAAVVLVAINPARQFKIARDSQRVSNITAILNAVGQNMAEHKGNFVCGATTTPIVATSTIITNDSAISSKFDIANCLVPNYISSLPFDPNKSTAYYKENGDYNTGYYIEQNANGRITIKADGEITSEISVTR